MSATCQKATSAVADDAQASLSKIRRDGNCSAASYRHYFFRHRHKQKLSNFRNARPNGSNPLLSGARLVLMIERDAHSPGVATACPIVDSSPATHFRPTCTKVAITAPTSGAII